MPLQVAAKVALDVTGNRIVVDGFVTGEREPSLEVDLDGAIQQRALWPPPTIQRRAVHRCLLHHRHAGPVHPARREGRS